MRGCEQSKKKKRGTRRRVVLSIYFFRSCIFIFYTYDLIDSDTINRRGSRNIHSLVMSMSAMHGSNSRKIGRGQRGSVSHHLDSFRFIFNVSLSMILSETIRIVDCKTTLYLRKSNFRRTTDPTEMYIKRVRPAAPARRADVYTSYGYCIGAWDSGGECTLTQWADEKKLTEWHWIENNGFPMSSVRVSWCDHFAADSRVPYTLAVQNS